MPLIRIDCVIPAPPAKVWAVLADFDRYEAWNPLNVWACGQAGPGARIDMRFRNLASPRDGAFIRQTVRLVACEPERELAWAGAVPLLFHGRHGFLLTPHRDGTHLQHTEALGGLVPMAWSAARLKRDFEPAYEAVNAALAARVAALG